MPSISSSKTTSTITTATVGCPQKTKIRPTSATAPTRRMVLCAPVHTPTGPVRSPARSPSVRTQSMPDFTARLLRTAAADGPTKNAAAAMTRATTATTRSPSRRKRTSVSNSTEAASDGSTDVGTLFR